MTTPPRSQPMDATAPATQGSPVSETLKPCPFCGGRANVYVNEVDFVTKWSVGCGDCNCNMDVCEDTPADAAVEWNTRTPGHAQRPTADAERLAHQISRGTLFLRLPDPPRPSTELKEAEKQMIVTALMAATSARLSKHNEFNPETEYPGTYGAVSSTDRGGK